MIADKAQGRPVHLVLGLLANKDMAGVLRHLAPVASALTAVPVPDHPHHAPADLARAAHRAGVRATASAPDVSAALAGVFRRADPYGTPPVVLIAGSLYLAGEVLTANEELPD